MATRNKDPGQTLLVITPNKPERSSTSAASSPGDAERSRSDGHRYVSAAEKERVRLLARVVLFGDPSPVSADRYALCERIGRGGLGVVYRAHDLRLDRDIAIKFVPIPRGTRGDDREMFREALTLARLSHRNIVPVFDVGRIDDEIFIAMELLRGETFEAMLRRGPLPWRSVVPLFMELGDALASAHRAQIVHGDVKPGNIIVEQDGHARLLDFGLARGVADALQEQGQSSIGAGHPSGTAGYIAPECHEGRQDGRADQFALCVVLYRALLGRFPFEPTWRPLETVHFADVSLSGRGVPRSLITVVRRGLSRAPGDRFADMSAFVEALGRVEPERRRSLFGVGALVVAGAAAWFARPEERCRFDDVPFAGVWDESVRAQIDAVAPAEQALALAATLDGHVAAWTQVREASCDAASRDAISPVLYDLRLSCLASTRDAIAYALDRTEMPGFDGWPLAVAAVGELADLGPCTDDPALLEGRPTDTSDPDTHAAIHRGLDLAYVDLLLGDSAAYLDRLLELEHDLADLARAPEATLWLTAHLASALNQRGRHREAIDRAKPALLEAERRPRWRRTEGALLLALSEAVAQGSSRGVDAVLLAEQALATFAGSEASQPFVAAGYRALAGAALAAGDAEAALVAARAARQYDDVPVPRSMAALATRVHELATANWEGLALARLGRIDEAEAAYRRGLAAARPGDPRRFDLARVRNNLGLLLGSAGRLAEAREQLTQAAAIKGDLGLFDDAATTWMNLGNTQSRANQREAALASYDEALRLARRPAIEARVRFNRAITLHEVGRLDDARADYAFVVMVEATTSSERRQQHSARIALARVDLDRGDRVEALASFEAAVAAEPADSPTYDKAELRLGLALAQPEARRGHSIALVREALRLATAGGHEDLVGQAEDWLAEHDR